MVKSRRGTFNLVVPFANSVVYGLIIPVVNAALNPASYINGVLNVDGATVVGLINAGIAEFNHFFGWLIPPVFSTLATADTLTTDALTATSDVAAVPPPARKALAPLRAIADAFDSDLGVQPDGADGVPKLSRFAERRAARAEAFAESPGAAVRGTVCAQCSVTRSLVKATVDAVTAAGADQTPKLGVTGISKAPSTAAKGLNDEVKKTIKGIQKVAKDVRKAVKAALDGGQG